MSVNFKQLDTSGFATTEDVDAIINDSEASAQSTYSSSKIDEDYQQKDSDISGGTVQYVASSSGNAPASGSMIGNIIGWLVGKCNGIGNISNLLTVAKSNLVAAINELRGEIGDLTQLDTTEKTDLVAAINKLNSKIQDYISGNGTDDYWTQKLGNIIVCIGTTIITTNGGTGKQVFSNSNVNSRLGVTDSNNTNTVVLFANGDGSAQSAHLEGSTYQDGGWNVVSNTTFKNGPLRVNYLIVYRK